jgi:hypothetical protein
MPQDIELQNLSVEFTEPALNVQTTAYRSKLNHWAIARSLSNTATTVVARFRTRSDADGHLRVLCQRFPTETFSVVFDPQNC